MVRAKHGRLQVTNPLMPAGARAAVLGHPVSHSRSPLLHSTAYAELNAPIQYSAIDIEPEQAKDFAYRLRTEPGWVGVSVTMPMKDALVPLIDEPSDRVKRLGALNTIVVHRSDAGVRLSAENTDVDGIVRALALPAPIPGHRGPVLGILGNGNTALAALEACALLRASRVVLLVRNPQRAADIEALAKTLELDLEVLVYAEGADALSDCDALVSTLPPLAADGWLGALKLPGIKPGAVLLDVAYDPWPSVLATGWEAAGGTVVSGLSMLVHQGLEQVKLFTGIQDADWGHVTNVMCDAVGLSRP